MMPTGPLGRIVRQNLRRNLRHFLASAIGIVFGIAAFVFFLALSGGVRKVFLSDIFPIDRVEVIAPKTSLTGGRAILDDALVEKIRQREEVERSVPKMKMAFPAKGWGDLEGRDLVLEVGGFCDGIDPVLIEGDEGEALFKDWEALEQGQTLPDCQVNNDCEQPHYYCGELDKKCHRRVPVLVSRTVIEIYNGSFAPSHGMPRIGAMQEQALRSRMRKLNFKIALGDSVVRGMTFELKAPIRNIEAQLVGISDKAMPIGMTVPIGYIKRWNAEYAGPEAAKQYSSIVVDVREKDDVGSFVSWIKKEGYETEDSQAERISTAITLVTLLFLVISFVIIGLSAVNIAHTFFMLISERRREIGILRAVGASRGDVRKIILAEAGLLGLVSGGTGVLLGWGFAKLGDALLAAAPDFPFKPKTLFVFSPWLVAAALGFAVLFCLLGAFFPASRASRMQPAQALAS